MKRTLAQWRAHQKRWQQFHQWEATIPSPSVQSTPSQRLRWCEEALALRHHPSQTVLPPLSDEQVRHWRITRRSLPRRLPSRHGPA
jgi:hypothetical protein